MNAPIFIAGLSLIPGAGHLALGLRRKAAALFGVDVLILVAVFFVHSRIGHYLLVLTYPMVMIPAMIETYTLARGGESSLSNSRRYIVVLLLVTGFAALPLLWQSTAFSRRNKIAWSAAVPLLAALYFYFLTVAGMKFLKGAGNLTAAA